MARVFAQPAGERCKCWRLPGGGVAPGSASVCALSRRQPCRQLAPWLAIAATLQALCLELQLQADEASAGFGVWSWDTSPPLGTGVVGTGGVPVPNACRMLGHTLTQRWARLLAVHADERHQLRLPKPGVRKVDSSQAEQLLRLDQIQACYERDGLSSRPGHARGIETSAALLAPSLRSRCHERCSWPLLRSVVRCEL